MNYSIYGLMDILHDTHGTFSKSPNFEHNQTLYSYKSIREVISEGDKRIEKKKINVRL